MASCTVSFQPDLGERPLGDLTWTALSKVPPLALGVGGVMAGVWWIVGRRAKLLAEASDGTPVAHGSEPEEDE